MVFGSAHPALAALVWRIAFAVRRNARSFLLPRLLAIPICVDPAVALATAELGEREAEGPSRCGSSSATSAWVTAGVVIPGAIEAWWSGRPRKTAPARTAQL